MAQIVVTLIMFVGGTLFFVQMVRVMAHLLVELFQVLITFAGTVAVISGLVWLAMSFMQ